MNREQLKNLVDDVYREKGFVDVIRLANELGIEVVVEKRPEEFNACIEYDKQTGKCRIIANMLHSLSRFRFSVAHEIAHFVLHQQLVKKEGLLNREKKNSDNFKIEREADRLAGEILMPASAVKEYFDNLKIQEGDQVGEDIINQFARDFRVSTYAAAIRLKELHYLVPGIVLA
ncbi:MAG: ImmA/IrrE family metallo-endopeptidase [Candidatus Dojkabacteria bacterium]